MSEIEKNLLEWSNSRLSVKGGLEVLNIRPLRQEASARKYFRINSKENTYVGVYSPPEVESNEQFIFLANLFKSNGVTVPEVVISDENLGFMLVEDFGDKSYQFSINKSNYHHLYSAAIEEMITIQSCTDHPKLPSLSKEDMSDQMDLFRSWFLSDLLHLEITYEENELINELYTVVLDDLVKQPQVLNHFDFESRNLMVLENGTAGVLDFQDATFGPIFLDPVSLLKDLYFEMNEKEIDGLLTLYLSRAYELGLIEKKKTSEIKKSFDLTGLQRQLRIMGTLSRLYLRDNKPFRLTDLIKTLEFATYNSAKYKELKGFSAFLKNVVSPVLTKTLNKIL